MIRVGKRIYHKNGSYTDPTYPNFSPIICMTQSSPYGSLSPYCLKEPSGILLENRWQFSKCYSRVPAVKERYSRWNPFIIWEYPAQTHVSIQNDEYKIHDEYFLWRQQGMLNPYPVRYPVGYKHKSDVLFSLSDDGEQLNYIGARKKIYLPWYLKLVSNQPQFQELKQRLLQGENLLIIEVDGPVQSSLSYYQQKYGVPGDWIEEDTILATTDNLTILLEDGKHPFGHGYCLAVALLDLKLI